MSNPTRVFVALFFAGLLCVPAEAKILKFPAPPRRQEPPSMNRQWQYATGMSEVPHIVLWCERLVWKDDRVACERIGNTPVYASLRQCWTLIQSSRAEVNAREQYGYSLICIKPDGSILVPSIILEKLAPKGAATPQP